MPKVGTQRSFFTNDKSFILTGSSLDYLTAFLNTKIFKFTFREYFPELLGETRELRKVFFENVTVIPVAREAELANILAQILAKKKTGEATASLEEEIDEIFYELYELTQEERCLVSLKSKS